MYVTFEIKISTSIGISRLEAYFTLKRHNQTKIIKKSEIFLFVPDCVALTIMVIQKNKMSTVVDISALYGNSQKKAFNNRF